MWTHSTLTTFIKIRFNCSHSTCRRIPPLSLSLAFASLFSSYIHTLTSALRQTMRMCIRKESNENNSIPLTVESSSSPIDHLDSPSSGHLSLHHFLDYSSRSLHLSHNDTNKSASFVSRKSVHESSPEDTDTSHLKNLNKLSWPSLSSHLSRYPRLSSPSTATISPSCTKSMIAVATMAANVTSNANANHSIANNRSSTSSFCIDALLSRDKQQASSSAVFNQRLHSQQQSQSQSQQQQQQSPTPTPSTDLDASNNSTSPRIFSPLGSDESRPNSACVTDDRSNSPVSNVTSNLWSQSPLNGQSSHHRSVISNHSSLLPPNSTHVTSGHPLHPLFHTSAPPSASLYAAMYGGNSSLHPPSTSASGHHPALTLLPHASAFHAPLGDLKNQAAAAAAASSLSMDWFTRAGLLYHRTPGKFSIAIVGVFLPSASGTSNLVKWPIELCLLYYE